MYCEVLLSLWNKYTVYHVHCRKIQNIFVRVLIETDRKTSLCQAFLACFTVTVNKFYFYRQCQEAQYNWQILLKRTEASFIPVIFNSVFCHVSAILLSFVSIHFTWIKYQEIGICMYTRQIKQQKIFVYLYFTENIMVAD